MCATRGEYRLINSRCHKQSVKANIVNIAHTCFETKAVKDCCYLKLRIYQINVD